MNLRQAEQEIMAHAEAGNAALVISPSGIGKSQKLIQIFEKIKARDALLGIRWGGQIVFGATIQPPDLIGYQFKGEKIFGNNPDGSARMITVTDPSCPLWYQSMPHGDDPGGKPAYMYDRFFLIVEEYGQSEPETKKGLAEVCLNGGTSPWYLPEGSIRVMASNEGSRYGVTKDFDFAVTRRVRIDIEGDVDVFLEDFADRPYRHNGKIWQTQPVTKAWAKVHSEILFEKEPAVQGPWCNPRALCAADRYLQTKWALQGNNEVSPQIINSLAGTIGMPATQSFVDHLRFRLELPSYDAVVADPDNTPMPNRADLLMLMAYELAGFTKVADLAACIKYVQRMPKDFGVTYIASLLRRDYKGIINQPAMQGWISKNAALVSIVGSLAH